MALQVTEPVEIGQIKVSRSGSTVFHLPNLSTGIAVLVWDSASKTGGVAHVLLPDSSLAEYREEITPGRYADLAIPELFKEFVAQGGQKASTVVCMAGGAQLFNFGGGGGNALNVGSRNAVAIRTAWSKLGLPVEKTDIGGNKARNVRFTLATGEIYIVQAGKPPYKL